MSSECYCYQNEVPAVIHEAFGLKISLSSIQKRFAPSAPGHPEPDAFWGGKRRPVYLRQSVIEWARANLLHSTPREAA